MNKVIIPNHIIGDGVFTRENKYWNMSTLLDAAKDLEVFDLQLVAIDLSVQPWKIYNIYNFIYHINRCNNTDLQYPVILDPFGYIIDGWHRVVKAILKGDSTIKAVRLTVMPEEDGTTKE